MRRPYENIRTDFQQGSLPYFRDFTVYEKHSCKETDKSLRMTAHSRAIGFPLHCLVAAGHHLHRQVGVQTGFRPLEPPVALVSPVGSGLLNKITRREN